MSFPEPAQIIPLHFLFPETCEIFESESDILGVAVVKEVLEGNRGVHL